MYNKKILITGCEGFIGKNLKQYFSKIKEFIILSPTYSELDLCNNLQVSNFLKREKPDIIIHSATTLMVNKGYPENVCEKNLRMFFNIYENMRQSSKLINLGSGSEYNRKYWTDNMEENYFGRYIPDDSHSYSKYIISKFIEKDSTKNIINLRLFGIYGEHEDYKFKFISNSIAKNILNLPITINQNCMFDYIHINDFSKICEDLIKKKRKYKTYNVTPDKSIDLESLANLINKVSYNKVDIKVLNKGMGTYYTGNNSRFREDFPDFNFISYEAGIKQIFKRLESNKKNLNKNELKKDSFLKYAKMNREKYFR